MALAAVRIARSPLGVRLDGSYSVTTSNAPINGATTAQKIQLQGWDADVTFTTPGPTRVKMYLLAGPGLYKVTSSYTQQYQSGASSFTKFGYNLGGGLTLGVLFVEARYVHVSASRGNPVSWPLVPVTAGLRFGGR
jgi:hypothetical protein